MACRLLMPPRPTSWPSMPKFPMKRSDDDSSESETETHVPVAPARMQLPADAANFTWKIHAISGIVHALGPEMDKLACGRPLSCNYVLLRAVWQIILVARPS